jgi:hypothetical protein
VAVLPRQNFGKAAVDVHTGRSAQRKLTRSLQGQDQGQEIRAEYTRI